jgi:methylated-DNA-[protein]-cysteine S-methyltransferase
MDDKEMKNLLREAVGGPAEAEIAASRRNVEEWMMENAPLIRWDAAPSRVGTIYAAISEEGVCAVDFAVEEADFLALLDPLARIRREPEAVAEALRQLGEYFNGERKRFDLPVDLRQTTPFQRRALQLIRDIPVGRVWTYKQVAEKLGRPTASRAVGQAMAHNPVPIIIPCHRVIATSGGLQGYGAGRGIESKRMLLRFEGALQG